MLGWSSAGHTEVTDLLPLDSLTMDYIEQALTQNPRLQKEALQVEAQRLNVPQAGAWSDPSLTLGLANLPVNSFDFNQEPMTGAWITLNQTIPLGGQLGLRKQIARDKATAAEDQLAGSQQSVISQVIAIAYSYAYLNQAVTVTDTNINIMDDIIHLAEKRYETGKGFLHDILRLKTQKSRLVERRSKQVQQAKSTGRQLAAWLGQNPEHLPQAPRLFAVVFPEIESAHLRGRLRDHNPILLASRRSIDAAQKSVTLARRGWVPDLKLGVGYGFRQDADSGLERPDFMTFTAGFSLPVFGSVKQKPAVAEARAMLESSHYQQRDQELTLLATLGSLIDQDASLAEQIDLLRVEIIPQTEAALTAALAAYSTGAIDVDALLKTQMDLIDSRLDHLSRVQQRITVRASIAALTASFDLNSIDEN